MVATRCGITSVHCDEESFSDSKSDDGEFGENDNLCMKDDSQTTASAPMIYTTTTESPSWRSPGSAQWQLREDQRSSQVCGGPGEDLPARKHDPSAGQEVAEEHPHQHVWTYPRHRIRQDVLDRLRELDLARPLQEILVSRG